ncbi:MAG: energy-coupling factor transporter transmembrane protein EcfT [Candidatus Eisenbacteria bacterium]|nr:energy-coupling factor transporter transmembrane protein EcfT [Candidatus Eisenbacteria bacterium]
MSRPARLAPLLLGALVGSLCAARLETGVACVILGSLAAAAAGAPRPPRAWLRLVGGGALVAIVLNALLTRGSPLGGSLPLGLHASVEGLRLGLLLALRLAGAAVALHGLRAAWPGERAADELARLLAPLERLRVPVREARMVLGLALRFAPLLAREAGRIARVQELRAGRPARGWREKLVRRRAIVVPALVNALERAERVGLALEARHYRARPPAPPARGGPAWAAAGLAVAAVALLWRG